MVVCISVQVGILQLFTNFGMTFLTWAAMLLRLLTHFSYKVWWFFTSKTRA